MPLAFVVVIGADEDFAARTVLEKVGRKFGRDQSQPAGYRCRQIPARPARSVAASPCLRDPLWSLTATDFIVYFQRAMTTLVPSPGLESIENSLESRLAPPRPSPCPCRT